MPDPRAFDYPQALFVGLALAITLTVVVAASTSSASFGVYNARWNGVSELRTQADAVGADAEVIRNTTAYGQRPANATVAVILSPDVRYRPAEVDRLRAFIRNGGTIVVAEDFEAHTNPLLAGLGVTARVDGRLLRDERYNYRSPAMPIARNVSNASLMQGVEQVTLNYGTAIEPHNATVLATTSGYAYLDTNRNDALDDNETISAYPVVIVETVGEGQVIVLGDPSALINVMLDRPGNRAFVRNLFGAHEYVLLDYSHVTGLPPLAVALLALRKSVVLQLVLGVGGIAIIGAWTRGLSRQMLARFRGRREVREVTRQLTESEMKAFLERRHPEWEEERVRRVIQGIFTRRDPSEGND